MAENIIHDYLIHLKHDREFFYVSSLEKAIEIIDYFCEMINGAIDKFDEESTLLQKQYIKSEVIIEKCEIIETTIKRTRSKSPKKEK